MQNVYPCISGDDDDDHDDCVRRSGMKNELITQTHYAYLFSSEIHKMQIINLHTHTHERIFYVCMVQYWPLTWITDYIPE